VDGKSCATDQEWAEIVDVPNWAGHSRSRAHYRFLAIREPLRQLALGDEEKLATDWHKLHAIAVGLAARERQTAEVTKNPAP
jgi:hypothetical protein